MPAAAKKTSVPEGAIRIEDLPDNRAAQLNEAVLEPVVFVAGKGDDQKVFTFKPQADWSYMAARAFTVGDLITWGRGALEDTEQTVDFVSMSTRFVGRVTEYFEKQAGTTRGEDSSSSTS